ncbi:MAG: hypothetical protein ACOC2L_03260 [Candidatus Sumerlaeota bacterium]
MKRLLLLAMLCLIFMLTASLWAQNNRPNTRPASTLPGAATGDGEEGFLAYFPPKIYNKIFDNERNQRRLQPDQPLGIWINTVLEFARQREKIDALREEQNKIFEELSLMRPPSGEESPFGEIESRGRIRQLLQAAQENEIALQSVMTELKKDLSEVVGNASRIKREIQRVSREINRAAQDMKREPGTEDLRKEARSIFELKRRLSDAEVLLTQIEKNPDNGIDLLLQELQGFVPRRAMRGSMAPILERLEEKLTRLERSQRFLQWRLAADEREIESLRRLLEKIHQNQSQMTTEGSSVDESAAEMDDNFTPGPPTPEFEGVQP